MNYAKAPFPYYGGKADAAPQVWARLGDTPRQLLIFGEEE